MTDPGYATHQDPRLQPPDVDENPDYDCWERCLHGGACQDLYERLVDGREFAGKEDEMVRAMRCETCESFEEAD